MITIKINNNFSNLGMNNINNNVDNIITNKSNNRKDKYINNILQAKILPTLTTTKLTIKIENNKLFEVSLHKTRK